MESMNSIVACCMEGEKGRFLRIVAFLTICARSSVFHTPAQTAKSHKMDAKGAMQALHRSFCVI